MFKQLRTCLVVLAIMSAIMLAAGAACYLDGMKIHEVGMGTLEVVFLVIDSKSDEPIPDARIQIHSEGGFYEGGDKVEDFELISDATGSARRQCLKNWWTAGSSTLHLRDYYHVRIPHWRRVEVRAAGYQANEAIDLVEDYAGNTQHVGPGEDRLVVRVPLKKANEKRE